MNSPIDIRTLSGSSVFAVALLFALSFSTNIVFAQMAPEPDRGGFTFLINFGPGYQTDVIGGGAVGFGGLNLGVGDFLKEDLAVLIRLSATHAEHESIFANQVAGVAGATLQYWLKRGIYLEGGMGIGFATRDLERGLQLGVGVLVGTGITVFNRRKNNVHVGVEYTPAFLVGESVHNLGFKVGYQLL